MHAETKPSVTTVTTTGVSKRVGADAVPHCFEEDHSDERWRLTAEMLRCRTARRTSHTR